MKIKPLPLTPREKRMIVVLEQALRHISDELFAAGWDEVKQHPTLLEKWKFHSRAERLVTIWKGDDDASGT